MNIKIDLAEEIGNSKFQNTVKLSPWFMNKGTMEGRINKNWVPPLPINVIIGSQASDVIGLPIYYAFFDEISFLKNQDIDKQKAKAIDMIDTAIGGIKTRFLFNGKIDGLLILASSKRSEKSFLETHMKKKLETEKENVLIVDEAVWNVKPPETYSGKRFNVALGNKFLPSKVIPKDDSLDIWKEKGYNILSVPVEFKSNFLEDIERALCDFAGISSSEISKYISGQAVTDIVNPKLTNPFTMDIIEVGNASDDKLQYYDFFDLSKINPRLKSKPLFIHLDMSINGDMTGIGGVWVAGKKLSTNENKQSQDLFYTIAFSVSIKAPKGRQISFEKNRNLIYWLKEKGFNIKGITSDTFQSYDTGQALIAKKYPYSILSVDRVDQDGINKPYQYFKSTIYEKRLEIYKSDTLIDEIVNLERNINNGKIDHPEGFRKDISDAICGALFNASKHAEEFAFDYGESIDTTIEISKGGSLNSQKEQIRVAFEDELKNLLNPMINKTEMSLNEDETKIIEPDIVKINKPNNSGAYKPLDFGFGKAVPYKPVSTRDGIIFWG